MKTEINVYEYMNTIVADMKKGVLLTTKCGDKVNTMSISWGQIGFQWNELLFTTYVRASRYTHEMLESNGLFTVNLPNGADVSKIISYCGTKSGGDTDKIADMGLTVVAGEVVDVPGILELPLTLECEVVYKQQQDMEAIPVEYRKKFYPMDDDGREDCHTMYYGKIVKAYILG